jgi:DNA-binding transcriptional ArsR family regulator
VSLDFVPMLELEARRKMATSESSVKSVSSELKTPARKKPAKGVDQRFKQAQRASILLKHVSDPTRLQVILMLADGEKHVGSLCEQLGQSQPAVSHHLALLRHGGVIAPRRQGKNNFYSLTDKGEGLSQIVRTLIV